MAIHGAATAPAATRALLARLEPGLPDRYRIVREIGHGGMAVVFLADDLPHHRQVALKVVRTELALLLGTDRFQREIDIAARLQHPHILPLLDSGAAAGLLYYVMPFVEGRSLRQHLASTGPLPIDEAVRILRDVTDALTEAHAHGVVHRDIKPDNILLHGRHAVVTDFGVAKAISAVAGRDPITTIGIALGTPAYMAPEQAAADPALDHRVDLYAVGVVGYEMLAGRVPFEGASAAEVLAAQLSQAPRPIAEVRPSLPQPLAQLVMRCLEKDPARRHQSADELLGELDALVASQPGLTPARSQAIAVPKRRRYGAALAGAAVIIAGIGTAVIARRALLGRLELVPSRVLQVTSDSGVEYQPAISPDGNSVAYVEQAHDGSRLVIRSAVDVGSEGRVVTGDTSAENESEPSWSADGDRVRFLRCRGQTCSWYETGRLGGTPRRVPVPAALTNRSRDRAIAAWAPDGRIVFTDSTACDTIYVAPPDGGPPRVIAVHPTRHAEPLHSFAWSPDGRLIAYVDENPAWRINGNIESSSLWLVAAAGGRPRRLTNRDYLNTSPVWLDARHLAFISTRDGPRQMYVAEIRAGDELGEPHIVPGVSQPHTLSFAPRARRLAYSQYLVEANIRSYAMRAPVADAGGQAVTAGNQVVEEFTLSPDGKWIVYDSNRRGNMDLYKLPATGGSPELLTNLPGDEMSVTWSPDGREIAFVAAGPDTAVNGTSIMTVPSGGGTPQRLTDGRAYENGPRWSPDGLAIAFLGNRSSGRWAVWLLTRDSLAAPWRAPRLVREGALFPIGWTPDGRSILTDDFRARRLTILSPGGQVVSSWPYESSGIADLLELQSTSGSRLQFIGNDLEQHGGIWEIANGTARRLARFGFRCNTHLCYVRDGRVYATLAHVESDIWTLNLGW